MIISFYFNILLRFLINSFYNFYKQFFLSFTYTPKFYSFVTTRLYSVPCVHITVALIAALKERGVTASNYCALCHIEPLIKADNMANCSHDFVKLNVQTSYLGMTCDFGGATHTAVTSITSMVHTCPICHAIICSGCYVG